VVAGNHDRCDASGSCGSNGFNRFRARRIRDSDEPDQPRPLLLSGIRDGNSEDAESARGHLGVGFEGGLGASAAQRQNRLDGPLDVDMAVGALDRHQFLHRVERALRDARVLPFDVFPLDPSLPRRRKDREFGWVPSARATIPPELGVGTRSGREEQMSVVAAPELADAHDAGRQSSGLVGADDGRTAQGLDRRKATDQHVTGGHPLHAHGERNRHDGGQTFGNGGDGKCDRRHEHFDRRQTPQKTRQSDDRDDPGADVQQSSADTRETALQRRDGLFGSRQQVRDPSELGLHACCDNFRQPGARRDRRSGRVGVVVFSTGRLSPVSGASFAVSE
jgi:hypothetical protein